MLRLGAMSLKSEIWSMYQEIVDWKGDFGDPIGTGSFNPFDLLRQETLTDDQRQGVCVAMLCYLQTAIDNSTYNEAVSGPMARQVRLVLHKSLCEDAPILNRALNAFLESEDAFVSALDVVYHDFVIPQTQG